MLQTHGRWLEDSIPALRICTGCFHCFLSHHRGFAHLAWALNPHAGLCFPCKDAVLTPTNVWYPLLVLQCAHLPHSAQDPISCSVPLQLLPASTSPYLCQHQSLPLSTPGRLEDWIILANEQRRRGSLWFIKGLSVSKSECLWIIFSHALIVFISGFCLFLFLNLLSWIQIFMWESEDDLGSGW